MNKNYNELPNGYLESIDRGIRAVRGFQGGLTRGNLTREESLEALAYELLHADAVVIGAGAGLSTAAGYTYSGSRFDHYFYDFKERFGLQDMYSAGFFPYPKEEIRWAFWARNIYINRYLGPPGSAYQDLLQLVQDKDHFVITTNVDHCFQRAGFDKKRLFYTQGDYGLFQNVDPSVGQTFDNEDWVIQALQAQGFVQQPDGTWDVPTDGSLRMELPTNLIPVSPIDGGPVKMNLRADETFVEDAGWHRASAAYADFLKKHHGQRVVYLEIGVGMNTPVIIKYPFWAFTQENEHAVYACLNFQEAYCPEQIERRSICISGDSAEAIRALVRLEKEQEF